MFGMSVTIIDNTKAVAAAAAKASFRNIAHAASSIRKDAIESIIPSDSPSAPGQPIHTRVRVVKRGKNAGKQRKGQAQRAIVFDVTKTDAIIGPRKSIVGLSFAAHEFGGTFHGEKFAPRPTMYPALERQAPRFADSFAGSITGG